MKKALRMISEFQQSVLKSIVSRIEYEECLLFGSYARGEERHESDVDLLLIVKQQLSGREKIKLASRIREECAEKKIDVDIIIKSRNEVDYYKDKTGHIVKNALAEAVPAW